MVLVRNIVETEGVGRGGRVRVVAGDVGLWGLRGAVAAAGGVGLREVGACRHP